MKKLTIGADPEFLLFDPFSKSYVPSIGLLGGTKDKPLPIIKNKKEIGKIQEDNVMGEFCVPVAKTANEFKTSINNILAQIQSNLPSGLCITREAAAYFDPNLLRHPQAKMVGCDPDFDAWDVKRNPTPQIANGTLRTCGGHVHVGMPEIIGETERDKAYDRVFFTRWLDLFLGVPSILLDTDTLRKQFYGKAGAHRPKPYGVEYRVMSNFWIFSDSFITWVVNNVEKAYSRYRGSDEKKRTLSTYEASIKRAINQKDRNTADDLIDLFEISLPAY